MERSKDMFMDERIRLEIKKEHYEQIPKDLREQFLIKSIDVPSPEYIKDIKWCELKKEADKAYKNLKDREFQLRHE